jgi:TPR repeat protein
LGGCYIDGEGVEKNHEEALKWLLKAKEQGHQEAKVLLEVLGYL